MSSCVRICSRATKLNAAFGLRDLQTRTGEDFSARECCCGCSVAIDCCSTDRQLVSKKTHSIWQQRHLQTSLLLKTKLNFKNPRVTSDEGKLLQMHPFFLLTERLDEEN